MGVEYYIVGQTTQQGIPWSNHDMSGYPLYTNITRTHPTMAYHGITNHRGHLTMGITRHSKPQRKHPAPRASDGICYGITEVYS